PNQVELPIALWMMKVIGFQSESLHDIMKFLLVDSGNIAVVFLFFRRVKNLIGLMNKKSDVPVLGAHLQCLPHEFVYVFQPFFGVCSTTWKDVLKHIRKEKSLCSGSIISRSCFSL